MISFCRVNKYCKDDIRLIENYEQALNDNTQTWHCHHRLETDLGLSPEDLKDHGLYFNVPAKELIFLTKNDHFKIHRLNALEKTEIKRSKSIKQYYKEHPDAMKGENNPMFCKNKKDHMSEEAYNKMCIRISESMKRLHKDNPMSEETKQKIRKTWEEKYKNGYVSKMIGHVFSEERNQKIRESHKGKKNPMYGVPPKNKGKHKVWDNKELNIYHFE